MTEENTYFIYICVLHNKSFYEEYNTFTTVVTWLLCTVSFTVSHIYSPPYLVTGHFNLRDGY